MYLITRYSCTYTYIIALHGGAQTYHCSTKIQGTISEDINAPEHLVCPLTNKVFVDPVDTEYSHTYEREALIRYLDENHDLDPKARKVVDRSQIRQNASLKCIVDSYLAASSKTFL